MLNIKHNIKYNIEIYNLKSRCKIKKNVKYNIKT